MQEAEKASAEELRRMNMEKTGYAGTSGKSNGDECWGVGQFPITRIIGP